MNLKQNLFKLIYLFVLTFFSLSLGAKPFPKSFHTEYQLYQEKNILGEVLVNFRKKNNQYVINAKTNTEGIMKLLGDREIISQGKVSSNGFSPQVFKIKNKKKSKKKYSKKKSRKLPVKKKNIKISKKRKKAQSPYIKKKK